MKNNFKEALLFLAIAITSVLLVLNINKQINPLPQTAYRVYLDGKSVGVVAYKEELENYINQEQNELKEKYKVDKVYLPVGLKIEKEITYKEDLLHAKELYEKIKDQKPLTVNGYIFTIKGQQELKINVLEKETFFEAVSKTTQAFINDSRYDDFYNKTQKEIIDFGRLIEDIYVDEQVYYKKANISTNEEIYTNVEDLSKYLLFGTLAEQDKYVVKQGDTIEKVAYNNNLSVEEFLVANPSFTDIKNLLYEGQLVSIGLIDPKVSVIVEEHIVEKKVKEYKTEIRYDAKMLIGNGYELQQGVDGEERLTQKLKIRNGEILDVITIASEELKPAINRIYVKGGKSVANVADVGFWAWPTKTPYTITSRFGPRWGTNHNGVDICYAYGSPIYAANNGTVYEISYSHSAGNYVVINHNNGYYTWYGHLAKIEVKKGQVVERGQRIATMGNTGYHPLTGKRVGTHLHFGVHVGGPPYRGGTPIDPLRLY